MNRLIWLALAVVAVLAITFHGARAEPLLVTGPAGEAFEACGATYELPPVKAVRFHCCPGDPRCLVFRDGFE
jgi:hypothetical protein